MHSRRAFKDLSTAFSLGLMALVALQTTSGCKARKFNSDVKARNYTREQDRRAAGSAVMELYKSDNSVWAYKPNHDRYVTKMRIQVSQYLDNVKKIDPKLAAVATKIADPRQWVFTLQNLPEGKATVENREGEKVPFRKLEGKEAVLGATTTDYYLNEAVEIDDPNVANTKIWASLNKRQRTYADLIADPNNDLRAEFYNDAVKGGQNSRMAKMTGSFDANKVDFIFDEFKLNWKRNGEFFPEDSILHLGGGVKENKKSIAILSDLNAEWNSAAGQKKFSEYLSYASREYGAEGAVDANAFSKLTSAVTAGGLINTESEMVESFLASLREEVRNAKSKNQNEIVFNDLQSHIFNQNAMNAFLNDKTKQPADRLVVLNAALAPYHAFLSAQSLKKTLTLEAARSILDAGNPQKAALEVLTPGIMGLGANFKDSLGALYITARVQRSLLENLGYDSFDLIYRQFYSRRALTVQFGKQAIETTFDSQIRYFVEDGAQPDGMPNFIEIPGIGYVDDVVVEMKFPSTMGNAGYKATLDENQRNVLQAIDDQKNVYQAISPGNLGKKGFGFDTLGVVSSLKKETIDPQYEEYFKNIPKDAKKELNKKGVGKFIFQFGNREWLVGILTQAL